MQLDKPKLTEHRAIDITFVVAVLGECGVGKTQLVYDRVDQPPPKNNKLSPAINITSELININDTSVVVQYLDAFGGDVWRMLTCKICAGTHVVIYVFDVTNRESFEKLAKWLSEMQKPSRKTIKVLIGNKIDLISTPTSSTSPPPTSSSSSSSSSFSKPRTSTFSSLSPSPSSSSVPSSSSSHTGSSNRQVPRSEAESFAAKHEMRYFETSALKNIAINEPFEYILETLMSSKNKGGTNQKIVKGGLSFGKGNLADPSLKKILTALNDNPSYKKSDITSTVDWL